MRVNASEFKERNSRWRGVDARRPRILKPLRFRPLPQPMAALSKIHSLSTGCGGEIARHNAEAGGCWCGRVSRCASRRLPFPTDPNYCAWNSA